MRKVSQPLLAKPSTHFRGSAKICALFALVTAMLATPLVAKTLPGELAAKDRAVNLLPESPWQLDMAEDRCRLGRTFTSDNGPGMVLIEQLAPGQRFDITLAGPDFARARSGSWFYGGMRSDTSMVTINPLEFGIEGYENAILLGGVTIEETAFAEGAEADFVASAIDPEAAALVERIVLQRSTTIVSFETGSLEEAVRALNVCTNDLLTQWKLDREAHRSYRPATMPKEQAFFSRLHHELASAVGNEGHKALLRVRAFIETDGTVTGCEYEYSLSSGGREPDVCEDIRQMRFEPAISADGEAMASVYTRSKILSEHDLWDFRW